MSASSPTKKSFTPPSLRDGQRWNGLRIGLLGGSFNPAHHGHLNIARLAMARFGLDFVWWIVTPQNPLKDKSQTAAYEDRMRSVKRLIAGHPKMMATHLEKELGSTYTYDTVARLKKSFPKTDFLWICGMDNAVIFHRWDRWKDLAHEIPIVFIARPPAGLLIRNCPVRMLKASCAACTPSVKTDLSIPKIYWLQTTKMIDISSTAIRNNSAKSNR